ncbi:hypothetical protein [Paludifilum halophilum]|uniref:Transposase DDE domain-containing protein n=1 Tax=Paludifilum halophilum TaxID=1642702 RepID=A0A235B942_9BACL|nr:hypothetical protein [Paludifilum halophilum]OYD08796.1 hypothetical protein CHM34_03085 [Paludifilum halophilum]
MKQDTLLFALLQSLYGLQEHAQLASAYEYHDAARKFSSYDLLKYWIAAAIGRWKGFRHSEKQLPTCTGLPSVDHSTLAKKAREVPFEMMQEILHTVIQRTSRNVRRTFSLPFPIEALDSTTITVGKGRLLWAHFRGNQAGVKLHVRVNTADQSLLQVETSPVRAHDSSRGPHPVTTAPSCDGSRSGIHEQRTVRRDG